MSVEKKTWAKSNQPVLKKLGIGEGSVFFLILSSLRNVNKEGINRETSKVITITITRGGKHSMTCDFNTGTIREWQLQ